MTEVMQSMAALALIPRYNSKIDDHAIITSGESFHKLGCRPD